jgi:hypothetical protein
MTGRQAYDSEINTAYFNARVHGEPAEARIMGILRGGFLHKSVFYAHAGPARGVVHAPAADLDELRVHGEGGR